MQSVCQVPECGCKIKRPWNHISQGKLHGGLSKEDQRMYIELTKTFGEVVDVKPENEQNEQKSEDVVMSEDVKVKSENTVMSVVSAGRQRFGDTKSMPMYTLETPILVEFMK